MIEKANPAETVLEAYSDLLVRAVCNLIYLDPPQIRRKARQKHLLYRRISNETPEQFSKRRQRRIDGRDWPCDAHSMAGYKRLSNLADCVRDVLRNDIPGDFIETGVWRGGACILMRGIANAAGQSNRKVFLADSFEGLPPPNPEDYPEDLGDTHYKFNEALGVTLEDVRKNFEAYDLLDDSVVFLKGWFKDTLPTLEKETFSIVRLDGDMYESTIQAIEILYPKLSKGGYIIVDDYGAVPGCQKAITDYRTAHGIQDSMLEVDWAGRFWKKS